MSKNIYIGTSGWSYPHWKENFYPEKLNQKKWLSFYGDHFPTVEVNNSFYHLPLSTTVENWAKQVPHNFLFSLKGSRFITHLKKLKDCKESVQIFFKRIEGLKSKLGPILFQLPPFFHEKRERLIEFLSFLDDRHRYVFEFRHPSWFREDIYEILASKNCALCITDLNGNLSPEIITADFTYVRLHGPQKAYLGSYGKRALKNWQKKIENWNQNLSVFCYFDNDEKGYAVQDAKYLLDIIHY